MFRNAAIVEEINDKNLYLRKISKDDASFLFESLKDKRTTYYLSLGPLKTLERSKRLIKGYLKSWDKHLQFNYIIELRDAKNIKKIGSVSIWNISWYHRRADIGIWILPDFWNKGIGKRTLTLIKNISFFHLKLHRIEAHIAIDNKRSINLFKNAHFVEEGILHEYLYLDGSYSNAILLACLHRL
jgi:ribosomal-protein-alanine N-acetyltransferase